MRNYKINSINDCWSVFGSKCLTKEQDEILKSNGFRYQDSPLRKYSKHYCYDYPYGSTDMLIITGEEYLRFLNSGRYNLPCEIKSVIGEDNYKSLMKLIKNDIKLLKEYKILK